MNKSEQKLLAQENENLRSANRQLANELQVARTMAAMRNEDPANAKRQIELARDAEARAEQRCKNAETREADCRNALRMAHEDRAALLAIAGRALVNSGVR